MPNIKNNSIIRLSIKFALKCYIKLFRITFLLRSSCSKKKNNVKSNFFTFEKWFFHFFHFHFRFWKVIFSLFSFSLSLLKSDFFTFYTFPEKVLKWKKWKAQVKSEGDYFSLSNVCIYLCFIYISLLFSSFLLFTLFTYIYNETQ